MAGYSYGLDEGGAIPDDVASTQTDDNSGAAPVAAAPTAPDDNSGAIPVAQQDQQSQAQPSAPQARSGPNFNAADAPANAKRIIQYLMGADAAPQQVAQKFAEGVKHEYPGLNEDDANLVAVHKATELGGPQAGFAMLQYNRGAYNAKQSFALAALKGVDGKAADAQAAAKAATQASQHILDGSSAVYTAMPDGNFTATVKMPGTDHSVKFQLNPDQFSDFLDAGGAGQWDKVMEEGTPSTLQKVSAGGIAGTGLSKDDVNKVSPAYSQNDEPLYDPKLGRKAMAQYPWASQGQQRTQFMNQQEEAEAKRDNAVEVATQRGHAAARERAEGAKLIDEQKGARLDQRDTNKNALEREKLAQQGDIARLREGGRDKRAAQSEEGKTNRTTIAEGGRNARSAAGDVLHNQDQRDKIDSHYGVGRPQASQVPQAPDPGKALQQQAPQQRPPNVPPGAKLFQGKWYTRGPNGEAVPVQ